ncbi:hypothetical protein [Neptuniibacter pectenicola]|jgi:hypothetical protein|uniref:hypothetical protein n=1 Tax=Neptuniibacter pectenicola TaxID=1806669 RepID=UPI00083121BB|nr:hypothetical protein [Neptuniibacter pectenicola]|tara:strand:- start:2336 stop:2743 length:408 start_codon:yes stop_codon:yes gene_type:complete
MNWFVLLMTLVCFNTVHAAEVLVMRDPFSAPQTLQNTDEAGGVNGLLNAFGRGFRSTPDDVKVPALLFKGYVDRGANLPPMALIQIAGSRVHMVKEGDEINIDPTNPRHAIRITKISRLSLTIEAGTLGQMKVLR